MEVVHQKKLQNEMYGLIYLFFVNTFTLNAASAMLSRLREMPSDSKDHFGDNVCYTFSTKTFDLLTCIVLGRFGYI